MEPTSADSPAGSNPVDQASPRRTRGGRRWPTWGVAAAVVVAPLVLAAAVLADRHWAPVLDMAMTELRVRDVGGSHTTLIGLPGRIGSFPDNQGSHPGPASFYLLTPFYRLAGSSAYGLELGSIAINAAALALCVWIGWRIAGRRGALAVAAIAALAVRGYGLTVLTHPWNPYFPVLLWLLALIAAWAVLDGDHAVAPVVVVSTSIAAQTHVPYVVLGVGLCALVIGVMLARLRRADEASRPVARRHATIAVGVGVVVWLPSLIEQLVERPGNVRRLLEHFTGAPPEPAIATGDAVRLFFRHLDIAAALVDMLRHGDAFVHRSGLREGNGWLGAGVLAAWVAALGFAWIRRHRRLLALHAVIAVALAAGAVSMLRIFGKVWYYLTLWAWGTTLLVALSLVATVDVVIGERSRRVSGRPGALAAAGIVAAATALSMGAALDHDVPEPQLSEGLRAVVPAAAAALREGIGPAVGADGRYLVCWQDAVFIGAQGYGLLNELERRGFDVGVHRTWRTPATEHRVVAQGEFDAEIHLVTGQFIERWRERPGFVEVVAADVRDADQRQRFEALRQRVGRRLVELDRGELVEVVDGNLFGASLDPDLPGDVIDDLSEMLRLAEPVAVFLAPPAESGRCDP